ncbi:MAG TPA: hypothetical protein PKC59_00480 [Burkholderiaceae bacterium]|nr:hypothetical protein [Burkholderiaceae bacterium]HMZ00672.1 hypothetical protein [Burkholderiaceae bacterium]HNG80878.1 hypothetical protein [Burkholderiaceae bacterium]
MADADHAQGAPRYVQPLDATVAWAVAQFDEGDREAFEERAAIFEYDGGLPRHEAERRALALVRAEQQRRTCPPG